MTNNTDDTTEETYEDTFNDRIEKLKFVLTRNEPSPVLCIIQAWGISSEGSYKYEWDDDTNGHYVIAVGYKAKENSISDEDYVIFMDPSTSGAYTYITVGDFRKRWHDADDKNKLICPGVVINYQISIDTNDKIYPLG